MNKFEQFLSNFRYTILEAYRDWYFSLNVSNHSMICVVFLQNVFLMLLIHQHLFYLPFDTPLEAIKDCSFHLQVVIIAPFYNVCRLPSKYVPRAFDSSMSFLLNFPNTTRSLQGLFFHSQDCSIP